MLPELTHVALDPAYPQMIVLANTPAGTVVLRFNLRGTPVNPQMRAASAGSPTWPSSC